jgi:TonB family protein
LLIEAVMIINWFNPVVYLYRNAIKHIHEFIADRDALKAGASKAEYAMLLLSQTFDAPVHGLLNPFFNQSLLKQRIVMLQKSQSGYAALMKYGFSAPLFALMLILSSATISNSKVVEDIHQKAEQVFELPANTALVPVADTTAMATASIIQDAWPLTVSTKQTGNVPKKLLANKRSFTGHISAGKLDSLQEHHEDVFTAAEQAPEFPGGMEKFYQFLSRKIHYPKAARDNNTQGRVIVNFIVEKDGSLSNVRSLRDPGNGLAEAALQAVAASPKWIPGQENGKRVRVIYTVPVAFTLQGDAPKPDTTAVNKVQVFSTTLVSDNKANTDASAAADVRTSNKSVFAKGRRADKPLIIIDGKEVPADVDIRKLDAVKIKSVSVLKDKDAIAAYGAKGKKGVIQIITNIK